MKGNPDVMTGLQEAITIFCGAPQKIVFVANTVMWRVGPKSWIGRCSEMFLVT